MGRGRRPVGRHLDRLRRRHPRCDWRGQPGRRAAALRPRPTDTVRYSTLLAIGTLARRVAYLDDELVELTR